MGGQASGLRKCRGCGALVAPTARTCPKCKRGLNVWAIRNLTAACKSCKTQLYLHQAFRRVSQGATGYSVQMSGNSGTISPTGGGNWVVPNYCSACGDPQPFKHAIRSTLSGWPFWLGFAFMIGTVAYWQHLVTQTSRGHRGVTGFEASLIFWAYAGPLLFYFVLLWRRHRARQATFRRARAAEPHDCEVTGYALFAVVKMMRNRIKKEEALAVWVSPREATLPAE